MTCRYLLLFLKKNGSEIKRPPLWKDLDPPLRYMYIVVQCGLSWVVEYGTTISVVYCVNVSKQLEYKSSECIFFYLFYFKLNVVSIFYLFVCNVLLSMLNRCLWCHFGYFHDQNIEKLYYSRMNSRLIRTEWPHSDQSFSVLFWIKYV